MPQIIAAVNWKLKTSEEVILVREYRKDFPIKEGERYKVVKAPYSLLCTKVDLKPVEEVTEEEYRGIGQWAFLRMSGRVYVCRFKVIKLWAK